MGIGVPKDVLVGVGKGLAQPGGGGPVGDSAFFFLCACVSIQFNSRVFLVCLCGRFATPLLIYVRLSCVLVCAGFDRGDNVTLPLGAES